MFLKRTILTFFMNPFEVMALFMLEACRSFRIGDCGYSMQSIRHAFNTHAIFPSQAEFYETLCSLLEETKQKKTESLQNSLSLKRFFVQPLRLVFFEIFTQY